jgi:hypothetical protein
MVDALRRAQRMVTTKGIIIDVHPTSVPACLEVGDERIGPLHAANAIVRHAAADAALPAALEGGLFDVTGRAEFVYYTYGDTIEELRDHVAANWRDTRIGADIVERARRVLVENSRHVLPRVVEHVRLTSLRAKSRQS